ncbi:MAG: winged helix-turn-helix transcriptional regulator [Candidatus Bathyarchaeia archaeon]|nr:winged helix-turn-helix transcriptional regulator [Candidatus Bathyarchaeia archaeon]
MSEKNIIKVLGQSHAIKILSSLSERPMRFTDLKGSCESNRTRSARLKELEKKKLVKTVPKMIGRRAYTFYEITPRGKQALDLCKSLLGLESKTSGGNP